MNELCRNSYVTVSSGLRGFYAVLVTEVYDADRPNERGYEEPVQTGLGSYETAEEAKPEARDWAQSEGIPFKE